MQYFVLFILREYFATQVNYYSRLSCRASEIIKLLKVPSTSELHLLLIVIFSWYMIYDGVGNI
jgi:hypothetical protein